MYCDRDFSSSPRGLAVCLLTLLLVVLAVGVALAAAAPGQRRQAALPVLGAGGGKASSDVPPQQPSFAVGIRVLGLIDRSRTIRLKGGRSEPRTLLTYIRYPALGAPGETDVPNAAPAAAGGPYPLVVFGHGFAVTPRLYARLLQSWARAGYVVAAPEFPLGNADAPGGPDESDVINEPSDMSFVISSLLSLSRSGTGPMAGLLDPAEIAVAGHSDGGEAALALAYSRRFHDARVGGAVILSGAEMSGVGGYSFTPGSPPLLAAQGTADTFNEPKYTDAYFRLARRPKFLLGLLGAEHLPPYTYEQPQLVVVERATIAFLDRYLKHQSAALQRLVSSSALAGTSVLLAEP
jgi:pimeloyl-ACP methyl ester carboxylesterase